MIDNLFFWAKLGSEQWPTNYHPVLTHLIDVGQVARHLWTVVFSAQCKEWARAQLGLPDDAGAGAWLAFWTACHDIGKVSPCFQHQGDNTIELRKHLEARGFDFPSVTKPHGEISTRILAAEFVNPSNWPPLTARAANCVAIAVGGHHGIFPRNWLDMVGPLGNDHWAQSRRAILECLARLFGVRSVAPPNPPNPENQAVWMYLAGLTSVADWIGSNESFFERIGNSGLLGHEFDPDRYFIESGKHAARALETLGWLGRKSTIVPLAFADLFPFIKNPRPLQLAVEQAVEHTTEPSLFIVEAPMGEGKTEAAWFAAAKWDERGGQGSYVALPTMATSNQMFSRIGRFLENGPGKKNLMLLHGKAALNATFESLKYRATVYDDENKNTSAVVAEGWFAANKKHRLLAPYGVGTIDQVLLAVLQTRHVFVRLFGLAGKCVILDEVHAYDAYMTTLMERLLRWLAALRCPVVLLSATLPKSKRLSLLRAYAGDTMPEPDEVAYPRVTTVPLDGTPTVTHVDADPARSRTVTLKWVKNDSLAEQLRDALSSGGCAVVVRNTVGLAQSTYLDLQKCLQSEIDAGELLLHLFHARFPFGRRKEIEDNVLRWFGRTDDDTKEGDRITSAPHRPKKAILVATQVVEQSLDLDFDVMITDVAPIDLVLQRAGRLHRHERTRPPGLTESLFWLIEPETKDGVPNFGASEFLYSPYVLFRSLLLLQGRPIPRAVIQLPGDIESFIDEVYSEKKVPEALTTIERVYHEKAKMAYHENVAHEEDEAKARQIKKPQYRGDLARVVGEPREEDSPDLHPAHQALTRLTRPTVELICLRRDEAGPFFLCHEKSAIFSLSIRKLSQGGLDDIKQLLSGELVVAHPGIVRELWNNARRPNEWKQVGLLSRHHMIVFTNGQSQLGPYTLLLDNALGLQVTRADETGEDE